MKEIINEMGQVIKSAERVVEEADQVVVQYRQTVFARFPILFALLVAFGVAATFFGIERIITTLPWLNDRPWLILALGLIVLAFTGKLYAKLSD